MSACFGESIAGRALSLVFGDRLGSIPRLWRGSSHEKLQAKSCGKAASPIDIGVYFPPRLKNITQLITSLYIQPQNKEFASMRQNRRKQAVTAQRVELLHESSSGCTTATAQMQVPSNQQSPK